MIRAIDKLEPFQRAIAKAHLASTGVAVDSLREPRQAADRDREQLERDVPRPRAAAPLASEVKKGILEAGGEPIEFNTIAICDGIAQGHAGMHYSLPHREIIADSVEAQVLGENVFDGVVYMASCDKIVPAMLMATGRASTSPAPLSPRAPATTRSSRATPRPCAPRSCAARPPSTRSSRAR